MPEPDRSHSEKGYAGTEAEREKETAVKRRGKRLQPAHDVLIGDNEITGCIDGCQLGIQVHIGDINLNGCQNLCHQKTDEEHSDGMNYF